MGRLQQGVSNREVRCTDADLTPQVGDTDAPREIGINIYFNHVF